MITTPEQQILINLNVQKSTKRDLPLQAFETEKFPRDIFSTQANADSSVNFKLKRIDAQ